MVFDATSTAAEVIGATRLDGRVAIVTGASGGIGLETAAVLAGAGADVTIAVRDPAKGEAAIAAIRQRHADARVTLGLLDLTSLASVRSFATTFLDRGGRLDVLVNNAGVMFPPLLRTTEGFELQFGTNHLGHFALTSALLPGLLASSAARVVNVSSGGHAMGGIDFDDPNFERREYDKLVGYGQSKTANILFAAELDRRFASHGVHAYSLHPGMIATDLGRHMDETDFERLVQRAKARAGGNEGAPSGMPPFKTIPQGAATSIWAVTAAELDDHGGAYCSDCAIAQPEAWASDADNAERLWLLSETLVGRAFGA